MLLVDQLSSFPQLSVDMDGSVSMKQEEVPSYVEAQQRYSWEIDRPSFALLCLT